MTNTNRFTINSAVWEVSAAAGQDVGTTGVGATEITHLTRTFGDKLVEGAEDRVEMWVDLMNVDKSGTYRDGSWWATPKEGTTVLVVDASHKGEEQVVNGNVAGGTVELNIARSGIMVNPMLGPELDIDALKDDGGVYYNPNDVGWNLDAVKAAGRGRTADNRINVDFTQTVQQNWLDYDFDWNRFREYRDKLTTPGRAIDLVHDDVLVLSDSTWSDDPNDLSFTGQNSKMGATPPSWKGRSAIRYQQALFIRDSEPASDWDFRPPVQWDRNSLHLADRPVYTWEQVTNEAYMTGKTAILDAFGQGSISDDKNSSFVNRTTDTEVESSYPKKPPHEDMLISPILNGSYYYSSQMNMYGSHYGNTKTYGGSMSPKITCYALAEWLRAKKGGDDAVADEWLWKLVQYGIDKLGAVQCRIPISSGAGQAAGLIMPMALFAMRVLGDDKDSCEKVVKWAWDIDDSTWDSFTEQDKKEALSKVSYEENVCRSPNHIQAQHPNHASDEGVGYFYEGEMNYAEREITVTSEVCEKYGGIRIPDGNLNELEFENPGQVATYTFDGLVTGFSRIDCNEPFIFGGTYEGSDDPFDNTHAWGHSNLIGCTLTIGENDHYIIGVSENIEPATWAWIRNNDRDPGEEDLGAPFDDTPEPSRIYVTPPLDPAVPATGTLTIKPFREGAKDIPVYTVSPELEHRIGRVTPSLWNDNYSTYFQTATATPYLLMRWERGDWTGLGDAGECLKNYWNVGDGTPGQPGAPVDQAGMSWQAYSQEYKMGSVSAKCLTSLSSPMAIGQ